jgi:hypothetical protein
MVVDPKLWGDVEAELARERAAGEVGPEADPSPRQIARVLNALGALGYFVGKPAVQPMVTETPEAMAFGPLAAGTCTVGPLPDGTVLVGVTGPTMAFHPGELHATFGAVDTGATVVIPAVPASSESHL